jgi:hypothetical protein
MNRRRQVFFVLPVLFMLTAAYAVTSSDMYKDFQTMKKPRYETGKHVGAQFCAGCHREIYEAWSQNSAHAEATTNERFLDFKDKFTDNLMLNTMMGEEMCYACHGSKEVDEGVNCETCHGTMDLKLGINETHEKKFKPIREKLGKPDFCARCHELPPFMTPFSDWQKSDASAEDVTCQGCHMRPRESELPYHGFDSISRTQDAGIYRNDLEIKDVKLDFPRFSLAVENRIRAHSVPAGGPNRILVLEISLLDREGKEIHKIVETFGKYFELMPVIGLMPDRLIEDTQLQGGETRPLNYSLPLSIEGQIDSAMLTLRFYDISDEHQGDLNKAHWISDPILKEEVLFQVWRN